MYNHTQDQQMASHEHFIARPKSLTLLQRIHTQKRRTLYTPFVYIFHL